MLTPQLGQRGGEDNDFATGHQRKPSHLIARPQCTQVVQNMNTSTSPIALKPIIRKTVPADLNKP
jgi:hypothetical protein